MVEKPHFNIPFVIAAGSGGGKIVAKLMTMKVTKIAVNSSWKDLDALPEDVVKVRAGEGDGSGMDPKKGEADYVKRGGSRGLREAIQMVLEKRGIDRDDVSLIPVIISAGHGFGSGSGPKIIEDLQRMFPKTPVIAFVTQPFTFEGEETFRKARECGKRIASKTGTVLINNQYVAEVVGLDQSISQILYKVNLYVSNSIDTFLRIATSESVLAGVDRTDLKRVAERGVIYMLTRSFKKDEPLERLYDSDSMLTHPIPSSTKTDSNMLAFIQSPSTPSTSLLQEVKAMAEAKFNISVKAFKPAIFSGGEHLKISLMIGGLRWIQE